MEEDVVLNISQFEKDKFEIEKKISILISGLQYKYKDLNIVVSID